AWFRKCELAARVRGRSSSSRGCGMRARSLFAVVVVAGMLAAPTAPARAAAGARAVRPHRSSSRSRRRSGVAAGGVTFTVTTGADFGDPTPDGVCFQLGGCSLHEAIDEANATPATDTIAFDIPGPDKSIHPDAALPAITSPVIIDGSTQPGFR